MNPQDVEAALAEDPVAFAKQADQLLEGADPLTENSRRQDRQCQPPDSCGRRSSSPQ